MLYTFLCINPSVLFIFFNGEIYIFYRGHDRSSKKIGRERQIRFHDRSNIGCKGALEAMRRVVKIGCEMSMKGLERSSKGWGRNIRGNERSSKGWDRNIRGNERSSKGWGVGTLEAMRGAVKAGIGTLEAMSGAVKAGVGTFEAMRGAVKAGG